MKNFQASPASQRGVSLIVALVMLIVLTLIGVSSMNTAVVELKMAGSSQQQGIALNRADELLRVGEDNVQNITDTAGAFDFSINGDGYYVAADNIDVYDIDWASQNLTSIAGNNVDDSYVIEYIGEKSVIGETEVDGSGSTVAGSLVYTFLITSRSATGKSAVRLVQSVYVTGNPP